MIEIFEPGQEATTMQGDIPGIITAIIIRTSGHVAYEFSYFVNGDYKTIWISDKEFVPSFNIKSKIGFK